MILWILSITKRYNNTPAHTNSLMSPTASFAAATTLWLGSLLYLDSNHRSSAIKEAFTIAGLCLFSARHELPVAAASLSWVVAVISTSLAVLLYFCSRSPKLLSYTIPRPPRETRLHSEPVFLRCRTHHTRFFPIRHSFAYSVLQCGIPLKFQSSIGRLFSFNNGHDENGVIDKSWSLFGIDSRDYLRRGNEAMEDKMKAFLSENVLGFRNVFLSKPG